MNDEDYLFENIYGRALRYFPEKLIAGERRNPDYEKQTGIVEGIRLFSDILDAEFAQAWKAVKLSDASLLALEEQVAHRLFSCLHKLLLQVDEVDVRKVNPSYVRFRFHAVLVECAFPQVRGEKVLDRTFDLDAVIQYARVNKLNI